MNERQSQIYEQLARLFAEQLTPHTIIGKGADFPLTEEMKRLIAEFKQEETISK
jgi:hypothetical protein